MTSTERLKMIADLPPIWSCDSQHIRTAEQAAQAFAAEYWAQPRKALAVGADGCFMVANGYQTYHVRYLDEVRGVHSGRFVVVRLANKGTTT